MQLSSQATNILAVTKANPSTSFEGPSLHPEFGEGRPGVVERRVGHVISAARGTRPAGRGLHTNSHKLWHPARGGPEGKMGGRNGRKGEERQTARGWENKRGER